MNLRWPHIATIAFGCSIIVFLLVTDKSSNRHPSHLHPEAIIQENPVVGEWVEQSLPKIMAFDYTNLEQVREDWKKYFSPDELVKFNHAIDTSEPREKIIAQKKSIQLVKVCPAQVQASHSPGIPDVWHVKMRGSLLISGGQNPELNPVSYFLTIKKNNNPTIGQPYQIQQLIVEPANSDGTCTAEPPALLSYRNRAQDSDHDNPALREWVEHALPYIMSFDYQNISKVRNGWKNYFSTAGLDSFNEAFDKSRIPESAIAPEADSQDDD